MDRTTHDEDDVVLDLSDRAHGHHRAHEHARTPGPHRPATSADLLRSHRLRVTPARQVLLEALANLQHGTPDQVHAWAEPKLPGLALSTVYRTLESFAEVGITARADLGDAATTYALQSHAGHAHLICRTCRRVLDADPGAVEQLRAALLVDGFELDTRHLPLFGTCDDCRAG